MPDSQGNPIKIANEPNQPPVKGFPKLNQPPPKGNPKAPVTPKEWTGPFKP